MISLWILIGIFIIAAVIAIRFRLTDKLRILSNKITAIKPYRNTQTDEVLSITIDESIRKPFSDIETVLENNFAEIYIPTSQKEDIIRYYEDIYQEAHALTTRLKYFFIKPSKNFKKFIDDFESIQNLVTYHNNRIIQNLLVKYSEFFDHCLEYPLDEQQRRSIVSEEDNCLVVSSAGSGKTSSIVGKVKYLIHTKKTTPEKILLISYTHKAAAELTERMDIPGLKGYTFHKLAIDLIGKTTGEKPSICANTDTLFKTIYYDLLVEDANFRSSILEYFMDYQQEETEFEKQQDEIRQRSSERKKVHLRAWLPDMDGHTIYVKSEQEKKICFCLSSLGIKFRYEEPYEHPSADEFHCQYKPDFSIYYEENGEQRRLYLEHYGVDEHGMVPRWFAEDKGISLEEANRQYGDGITWKKYTHKKFGTKLITTSSADFYYFKDIRNKLKQQLVEAGVPIHEKTNAELYNTILPKDSKQEKAFIRLAATFVSLLKSSCKTMSDVSQQANNADDKRSVHIIQNIFQPFYKKYVHDLQCSRQIDFTDLILYATDICRAKHPVEYDYIIVDEFQDISIDRYQFLKALRESNPSTKLYCVGDDWQSIYRFSGSDMALFSHFPDYFGATEINKIETTYRFGEPLISLSSKFIQQNQVQIKKNIRPFSTKIKTELSFYAYDRKEYCYLIERIIASIPPDKSIFLLGRYSFDDYYLSSIYKSVKKGDKFYYMINNRKIEFLTVHKSKGLEADYVILLQCNKDIYGFPTYINDDPVLGYVLTKGDQFPFGEERRLFYVAITRAKEKTFVLYDKHEPSIFVDEFLPPKLDYEK